MPFSSLGLSEPLTLAVSHHAVRNQFMTAASVLLTLASAAAETWTTEQTATRIEARCDSTLRLAWQKKPLTSPKGGDQFAASAFLHPLRTPSGFEWTTSQPTDHLHHFGLWWPWKFIEVNGQRHNCWEIQQGQAAWLAKDVKTISSGPTSLKWQFLNDVVIRTPDSPPKTVIHETATVSLTSSGDTQTLDITLLQKPAASPVTIIDYRYSGFTWRGPASWNKDNSHLTTSEGKDRDHANATQARWVLVSGPTPNGSASVLLMSAATHLAGNPEHLRVWDSKTQNGTPFVNFNPVQEKPLPLDSDHPAVSHRHYRVIAADHIIDAKSAESAWHNWRNPKPQPATQQTTP